MAAYHSVLFDLDGTLTDSEEGITRCVQHALRYFGIEEQNQEKLKRFIGPPLKDMFRELYGLTEEEASTALEKYRERFSTVGLFENHPYEGIAGMLEELKKAGVRLGVATSKPLLFSRQILDKFELSQYFDVISGADMAEKHCSKEDVIRLALERFGSADAAGFLMVGDRCYDVEGAAACGIPCIGVRFGFAQPGELEQEGAAWIVENVEELKMLLRELCV